MTDLDVLLHTDTHAGVWVAVEVALAIAALAASTALVAALLRAARDGTSEARLAAAFSAGGRDGSAPTDARGDRSRLTHLLSAPLLPSDSDRRRRTLRRRF